MITRQENIRRQRGRRQDRRSLAYAAAEYWRLIQAVEIGAAEKRLAQLMAVFGVRETLAAVDKLDPYG